MTALDTSLLVYAHRSAVAEHRSARQAIVRARRSSGGWGFSAPVVGEFWSVVTHPTAAGRPSAPEEAHRFIVALEAAGTEVMLQRPSLPVADQRPEAPAGVCPCGKRGEHRGCGQPVACATQADAQVQPL